MIRNIVEAAAFRDISDASVYTSYTLPKVSQVIVLCTSIQGDTSGCYEPPVDIKTKVLFLPGLSWPGQAKTELLF